MKSMQLFVELSRGTESIEIEFIKYLFWCKMRFRLHIYRILILSLHFSPSLSFFSLLRDVELTWLELKEIH